MGRGTSNVVGFDDGAFLRSHRGDVPVVGVVTCRTRVDGILVGKVRRDGSNGTRVLGDMLEASPFLDHIQVILLQGIALAGFNVIDVHSLHERLSRPVLVVMRRRPRLPAVESALRERVAGGARKWRLVERAGPIEPLRGLFVQRVGLDRGQAAEVIACTTDGGKIPEPLRIAHLVAGAIATGVSRGRP